MIQNIKSQYLMLKKEMDFFVKFFYNEKNYNVLILNNNIIEREDIKNKKHVKIKYENKIIVLLIEDKKYY